MAPLSFAAIRTPRTNYARVTLAWNHSASSNIVAYRIFYGTNSAEYTQIHGVGYTNRATITNLVYNLCHFFAAKAVDGSGNESAFSNEVSYTPMVPTNLWIRVAAETSGSPFYGFSRFSVWPEVSRTNPAANFFLKLDTAASAGVVTVTPMQSYSPMGPWSPFTNWVPVQIRTETNLYFRLVTTNRVIL